MDVRTGAVVALVSLLLASGCLSATPPKTPNQRAVERAAERTEPPVPPDANRHPTREAPPLVR